LEKCHKEVIYLSHSDPDTAEYKRRLTENKPNMEFLFKNKLILENDDTVTKKDVEKFWELIVTIKTECVGADDAVKKQKAELIFPWTVDA